MKKIISINEGHNASCVYMEGGKFKFALQEERLSRIKNQSGFPHAVLKYLRDVEKIDLATVDAFILTSNYLPFGPDDREMRIKGYARRGALVSVKRLMKKLGAKKIIVPRQKKRRINELKQYGVAEDKVSFYDHHTCHAASAYFGLGDLNNDILVFTNDGAGDDICATISVGRKGRLERIAQVHMDNSIGELWALFTAMMGMVPLEHEYKLMGLAPYAPSLGAERVKKILDNYFEFDAQGLTWRVKPGLPAVPDAYGYFREKMEFMRFDWVAAGLQAFTEEFLCRWICSAIKKTGIRRLALAGGTFMNVKANKRINELDEVESLFVFPSCGDETLPFGAAFLCQEQLDSNNSPLEGLYLGTYHSNDAVKSAFDTQQLTHKYRCRLSESITKDVAHLLELGNVVAWFQGREEFGARALGARSIIADPIKHNVINEINEMIKSRDFWMPFACSMLEAGSNRYLVNPKHTASPYMIMTFDTTVHAAEIEGGRHPYDKSCRPQVVKADWNFKYHNLLSEFAALTGRFGILNTSFNLHGLPIASSPEDAFHVLDKSGLKFLAIEDWIIEKVVE